METVLDKIEQTLKTKLKGGRVFIACSGGIDSMVLVHQLASVNKAEYGVKLIVLHVNYGLRGDESDGDHQLVQSYAESLGLPTLVLDLRDVPKPGAGIQEWAREQRYGWMNKLISDSSDSVALAHHSGDLAENVLFRMSRGTHRSLGGLAEWSEHFWRPFLQVERKEICSYASRQKVPYREDSSNAKIIYSRNRIRHLVLPELEGLFEGAGCRIADTARDIDQILEYLDSQIDSLSMSDSVSWDDIHRLPEPVGRRVISSYLSRNQCSADRERLRLMWAGLRDGEKKSIDLTGDKSVFLVKGRLYLDRKPSSPDRRLQYERHLVEKGVVVVPPGGEVVIKQESSLQVLSNDGKDCLKSVIKTT